MRPIFDRLARPFVVFVERFYPDAFVFAIVLTLVTFALAIGLTPTGPLEALGIWGRGLTGLLSFIAQVALTLVCAHALAHTDFVHALVRRVAKQPGNAPQAYGLVAFVAGLASLFAWSLGLVVGALLSLEVAKASRERGLAVHFPLLVASAYAGFVVLAHGLLELFRALRRHTRPHPRSLDGNHPGERDDLRAMEHRARSGHPLRGGRAV